MINTVGAYSHHAVIYACIVGPALFTVQELGQIVGYFIYELLASSRAQPHANITPNCLTGSNLEKSAWQVGQFEIAHYLYSHAAVFIAGPMLFGLSGAWPCHEMIHHVGGGKAVLSTNIIMT